MSPSTKHTLALVISLVGPAVVALLLQLQALHPEWAWLALVTPVIGNLLGRVAGKAPPSTGPGAAALFVTGVLTATSADACTPDQQLHINSTLAALSARCRLAVSADQRAPIICDILDGTGAIVTEIEALTDRTPLDAGAQ